MDFHIHSDISLDSMMNMESAIIRCRELGYKVIAFPEHVDIDFPGYGDKFNFDILGYFKKIDLYRTKFPDMEILKSVELGVTKDTLDEAKKYISKYDFDYVIFSDHIILNEDPYSNNSIYLKYSKEQLYKKYFTDIYENMKRYDDFDTLGHYDYITRYAGYIDSSIYYDQFSDEFDNILTYLAENNKCLEIDTRTYNEIKYGILNFDINILKKYKELGGKYICLGSDAHDVSEIGYKFDLFKEFLRETGFEHLTYYKNRKPNMLKI